MTELSGTLEGVGLPAVVRFVIGIKRSGCLRLMQQAWQGEIYFEEGEISGARLGTTIGLAALDAIVEVLPRAGFIFDSQARLAGEPSIQLSRDALLAHLDELTDALASGARKLPPADDVPVVMETDGDSGEELLPVDRAALQTLMLVDGQRSVREIVAQRGTFEVLWQLADLAELGLVRVGDFMPPARSAVQPPAKAEPGAPHQPPEFIAATAPAPRIEVAPPPPSAGAAFEVTAPPRIETTPPPASVPRIEVALPSRIDPSRPAASVPRIDVAAPPGIETAQPPDSVPRIEVAPPPSAGAAVELTTPPRIETPPAPAAVPRIEVAAPPPAAPPVEVTVPPPIEIAAQAPAVPIDAAVQPAAPAGVDAFEAVVRCPMLGFEDDPRNSVGRPTRLHRCFAAGMPLPLSLDQQRELCLSEQFATCPRLVVADPPNIIRLPVGRRAPAAEREIISATAAEPTLARSVASVPTRETQVATPLRARMALAAAEQGASPTSPRVAERHDSPPAAAPAATQHMPTAPVRFRIDPLLVGIAAVTVVLLAVGLIGYLLLQPQLAGRLSDRAVGTASQPAAAPVVASNPTVGLLPTQPPAAPTTAPTLAPTAPPSPRVLLDDRFSTNSANWPSDRQGTAWLSDGAYHLAARRAGQFVAIGAPLTELPADVVVNATFRKVGGPPGGGYGIVVRAQGPGAPDGIAQNGRYYVLEAGDKGEIGIWRRDGDHWVDLLPWQRSDAVKPGSAANELSVLVAGSTLSLAVNGTQVATKTDSTLQGGTVGLFAGGDGNEVVIDRFSLQSP